MKNQTNRIIDSRIDAVDGVAGTEHSHDNYVDLTSAQTVAGNKTFTGDLTVDTDTLHVDSTAKKVGIGTTSPKATLSMTGGESTGTYTEAMMSFGWMQTDSFSHFLHTTHNAGIAALNKFNFYTSDGTASGVFPANAVHGLTISDGKIGVGVLSPSTALDINGTQSFSANSGTWDGAITTGAQTFTNQMQATGQAATDNDSLMTLELGDARYGHTVYSVLGADASVTSSTTLVDSGISVAFPEAGTYELETKCIYATAGTASGVREGTALTAGSITFQQGERIATDDNNSSSATKYHVGSFANDLSASAGPDTHIFRRQGIITVSAAGSLKIRFAQWVSDAAAATIKAGSFAKITRIS